MSRRIVGMLLLAGVAGLLVTGCGGGDDASADVTKAQFTQEAEAVCAERKKEWDAEVATFNDEIQKDGGKISIKEQERKSEVLFVETLLPVLKTELEALEDLDAPTADEEQVEKMLQSRAEAIEQLEDKGVKALFTKNPMKTFENEAKAYGLSCRSLL
ncbi:MAG TPA: hypothetical protein VJU14_11205 [Solirubrobacterales bacterium]|nr:hypothetical protein [Solirubrobacterales bacterium]